MKELAAAPEDRSVVGPAREAARHAQESGKGNDGIYCGAAVRLHDGAVITGKNSPLMHASSSLVLNAIKRLAGMPDHVHLLSPATIESISRLKRDILSRKSLSLNLEDALIALSISATTNPSAQAAMEKLRDLAGCEMHITHMPPPGDEAGLRRLGVNLTSDPDFSSHNLFLA